MYCKNCGNLLQQGMMVCPYCNMPINVEVQPVNQPVMNQQYEQPKKKKHIVLWIIIGILALIILFVVIGFVTSKKLKCSTDNGSFSIYYSDNNIYACFTTGTGECDLNKLQENAKTYGVDTVINILEEEATKVGATCTK